MDRHQGGHNLDQQFEFRPEGIDIVKNTQDHDDHGPQHHPLELRGDLHIDNGAEDKAEENRQAAHPRDWMVVHPAAVLGDVHRPHAERQGTDHRRGDEGHHHSGDQGRGHPADGLQISIHW